jgi:hypothetical protein
MSAKLRILKYMSRRIRTNIDLSKEFPEEAIEYIDDAKVYADILYHLIKEGLLP